MNCDPIARWYRWLEYIGFGGALQRRRVAYLRDVADARRALVLGDGDGRFLARLVEQNREASIDYVDMSARMLESARARGGDDRVTYRHGDALVVPLPPEAYDLITTHFFLDCLDEREVVALLDKIGAAARPGAQWIVSEFRQPAAWARAIVTSLYFFFRISTGLRTRRLVDHHPLFAERGFTLVREETAWFGLLASELWIFGDNKSR